MAEIDRLEFFKMSIADTISFEKVKIGEFTTKLTEDAFHALSWADSICTSAARVRVLKTLLADLNENYSIDEVESEYKREVQRRAILPSRSTSAISNIMDQELLSAYAAACEMIAGYTGNLKRT